MTNIRSNLDKFDKFEKANFLPKFENMGSANPIRIKIVAFLSGFTIGEVQRLKCVDKAEANSFKSKIKYYSMYNQPMQFLVRSGAENNNYWVYVKRVMDAEDKDAPKELHNEHTD